MRVDGLLMLAEIFEDLDRGAERARVLLRDLGVSPVRLAFVYRFTTEGADRPLSVRATFRLSSSGNLVSPSWRVLSAEEVEDYTDRQLR